MHNAPSVAYPVGRCAFERQLYAFFACVASAVWLAWALLQSPTVALWLGACCLVTASVAGWPALRSMDATLVWDGQGWCLHSTPHQETDQLGKVHVCWDVQKALLLKWQPSSDTLGASTRWLWLGQERSPAHWQDVRRAVYARASRQ
jgi:hypothetical protein